nr:DUF29 domain-containing protein [Nodosilinea sp. TSF1-S3]
MPGLIALIEAIESLGRQERQDLRSRLGVLLGHLIKWHYQPEARSKSWRATIREQGRSRDTPGACPATAVLPVL